MSSTTDVQQYNFSAHWSEWTRGEIMYGRWKNWLNRMTPERLAQQRAYDNERGKRYYQEHKEKRLEQSREWHQQNKERLCEKHVCETCGGNYTTKKKAQHVKTKLHQDALANISPTCFKCDVCGGRYTDHNKAHHKRSKKHQAALQAKLLTT